jgi:protoheme IX farnesyltransferase
VADNSPARESMMLRFFGWKIFFDLTRVGLSLAVAFSAFAGYCVFKPVHGLTSLFSFFGVLLLSGACAALNQYQEQRPDGLMKRTENRPLPTKSVSSFQTLFVAAVLGLWGILLLFVGTTWVAGALGIFTVFWYNTVYTPLKKKTSFAFLIGAFTGALPPLIGYTGAGGPLLGKGLVVGAFLFFWQIPHFMLVLLKHGNDYARAGFPALSLSTSQKRFKPFVFLGLLATSLSSLLFPLFKIISNTGIIMVFVIVNVLFVGYFFNALVRGKKDLNFRTTFRMLYLYQSVMLVLIIGDALLA